MSAPVKPILQTFGIFASSEKVEKKGQETKYALLFWTQSKMVLNKISRTYTAKKAFDSLPPTLQIKVSEDKYKQIKSMLVEDGEYHLDVCPDAWALSASASGVWFELIDIKPFEEILNASEDSNQHSLAA
jgi:hypothetical protein